MQLGRSQHAVSPSGDDCASCRAAWLRFICGAHWAALPLPAAVPSSVLYGMRTPGPSQAAGAKRNCCFCVCALAASHATCRGRHRLCDRAAGVGGGWWWEGKAVRRLLSLPACLPCERRYAMVACAPPPVKLTEWHAGVAAGLPSSACDCECSLARSPKTHCLKGIWGVGAVLLGQECCARRPCTLPCQRPPFWLPGYQQPGIQPVVQLWRPCIRAAPSQRI